MQLRSYEYRRLHDVCCGMAQHSDSQDLQDRWLKLAQSCLDRAGAGERIRHSCATTISFDTATTVVEMALPTYMRQFHQLPLLCPD